MRLCQGHISQPTLAVADEPSESDSGTNRPPQYVRQPTRTPVETITSVAAEADDSEPTDETPTAAPTTVEPETDELRKSRTWTDHKGKTIEATFVSLANRTVRLRLASGKEVELPAERLSAPDRQLLQERLRGRR